ncbi:hypothetical protein Y1Q_0000754 [Alligator mississippiensis]|uniref:Uncharacterized protein n=1 Tax=Alligator mississippiensis TaxID=8496 RepID=A0A151MCF3_ALLMI|nr:hypothetical protein Y1Q_0000754 [Alligator mississippiensis]
MEFDGTDPSSKEEPGKDISLFCSLFPNASADIGAEMETERSTERLRDKLQSLLGIVVKVVAGLFCSGGGRKKWLCSKYAKESELTHAMQDSTFCTFNSSESTAASASGPQICCDCQDNRQWEKLFRVPSGLSTGKHSHPRSSTNTTFTSRWKFHYYLPLFVVHDSDLILKSKSF